MAGVGYAWQRCEPRQPRIGSKSVGQLRYDSRGHTCTGEAASNVRIHL
jgi:hypothetical protein